MLRSNQVHDNCVPNGGSAYNIDEQIVSPIIDTKKKSFYNYVRFRNKTVDRSTSAQKSAASSRISLSHQSIRWYHQRTAAYRFLQKPSGPYGRAYHIFVSILILICLLLTVLCTFQGRLTLHEFLILNRLYLSWTLFNSAADSSINSPLSL